MSEDRHTHLLKAGWTYDARRNYYQAPGSDPQIDRYYDQAAAWQEFERRRQAEEDARAATKAATTRGRRTVKDGGDPRESEPQ